MRYLESFEYIEKAISDSFLEKSDDYIKNINEANEANNLSNL